MATPTFASGIATGIGSLPHRDATAAARFSLEKIEMPCIPTLPKRSPFEGLIMQSVVGIQGVTIGQYGSIAIDISKVDPLAPVTTDLQHDAFGGFRAFLAEANGRTGPVKWQIVGPVTLGLCLVRAGVPTEIAFDLAVRAVRSHAQALLDEVASSLPGAQQVVFFDEPALCEVTNVGFPLAPDTAFDLTSAALAAVEPVAVAGLHVCGVGDIASMLAIGPSIISVPVHAELADNAGYVARFLANGGTVAWGVVATEGPISTSVERPWRALSALWCEMVKRGADPGELRRQSMVTPQCGLGMHSPAVAERVHRIAAEVGMRVRDQAAATRFALGA